MMLAYGKYAGDITTVFMDLLLFYKLNTAFTKQKNVQFFPKQIFLFIIVS
jgi:hypothetical protein